MSVVTDYTALLSGNYWNGIEVAGQPIIVTFSFPTSAPAYDTTVNGFTSATAGTFKAFSSAEQTQAIQALQQWASASGIVFVEVAPGQGDINFQNVDFNTTSYAGYGGIGFYPFGAWNSFSYPSYSGDLTASGDVFMNTRLQNPDGTVSMDTLLHEIGHAIGLKHPTEVVTDYAANPVVVHDQVLSADDPNLTVMSTVGETGGGAATLKTLDQQAAAFLYGPAGTGGVYTNSASGSNSVSSWSWDATTQTLTQTAVTVGETIHGTSVNDVIHGSSGDDHLFGLAGNNTLYGGAGNDSLYDGPGTNVLVGGTGNDTYYVSNSATQIIENSGEGYDSVYATTSYTLPDNVEALYLYGQGLTGKANNQGDTIYGDGTYATTITGGTGDDYLVGGAGNDTITGGGGVDTMYGGGGADRFVFTAASDAPVGGSLTTIGDFSPAQGDKIDLSAITTTGANPGQPLTYIGQNAFGDVAGQVREIVGPSVTILEGDLNGDGAADFEIQLYNEPNLQASDLILNSSACFYPGTHILTPDGEVPVEKLRRGDRVATHDGRTALVNWVGKQTIALRFADPLRVLPIRVKAGALADNVPARDLMLSPDHALFVDEILIQAGALVDGVAILRERNVPTEFVYYHIETDDHSLILAEGTPAETFVDNVDRLAFDNWTEFESLYPGGKCVEELPYPRAKGSRQVPMTTRARLAERARGIGSAHAVAV